jgi:hypothetical protein
VFCEWLAWILRIKRPGRELTFKSLLRKRKVRQLEALSPPSTSLINNVKDIDNTIPISPPIASPTATPGATLWGNGTTNVSMPTSYIGGYYDYENKVKVVQIRNQNSL